MWVEVKIKNDLEYNANDISYEDEEHAWDMIPDILCVRGVIPEHSHDSVLCVHDAMEYDVAEPGIWLTVLKRTERVSDNR